MRAATGLFALVPALTGCGQEPSTLPGDPLPPALAICKPHVGDDRLLGYCLASQASRMYRMDLETLCGQVEPFGKECRHNWATARARWSPQTPVETLLEACIGDSDCAFDVLDTRNPPDLVATIGHCRDHASDHLVDCVGHAVARWADVVSSAEEVARVGAADLGFDDMVGFHLATAVVCRDLEDATCPPDGPKGQACRNQVRQLRADPGMCPAIPDHIKRSLKR